MVNNSEPDPSFSILKEKCYTDHFDGQEVQFIESHGKKFTSLNEVKDYEVVRHRTVLNAHKLPNYQSFVTATEFFEFFLLKIKFKLMESCAYGDW